MGFFTLTCLGSLPHFGKSLKAKRVNSASKNKKSYI
jgi:hypothetical protein